MVYAFPASGSSRIYVDAVTGSDKGSGHATLPFKTLTHALSRAMPGTIISLAPGSYAADSGEIFPLVIPPEVMVIGVVGPTAALSRATVQPSPPPSPAVPHLVGSGLFFSPSTGYQQVTLVPGHDSLIHGIALTNPMEDGTGIWVEAGAPLLRQCRVSQCQRDGLVVATEGRPVVTDGIFEANRLSGILYVGNGAGTVDRCQMRSAQYGVTLRDRAAPVLRHNQITANRIGVVMDGAAHPMLRHNRISQNTDGLMLLDKAEPDLGTEPSFGENVIAQNQRHGIHRVSAPTADTSPATASAFVAPHSPAATKLDHAGMTLQSSGGEAATVLPELPANAIPGLMSLTATATSPGSVPGSAPGPALFPDLDAHWGQAFVEALRQRGIISGFPDGTFRPDQSLTRAQYAALIYRMFSLPTAAPPRPFRDVPGGFWGAEAIAQASAMGFIAGFPDGTFRPNQPLTRVQAIVSLVNGLQLTGGTATDLKGFSDRAQIPAYAIDEVITATAAGLIVNHPDRTALTPNRDITRAEMAAMLYQLRVITGQSGAIASPVLVPPLPVATAFHDVPKDDPKAHWATDFIYGLTDRRLMSGISPDQFAPEQAMSRAECAVVLAQCFNPLPQDPAPSFVDVPRGFWAASAIQRVVQSGVLPGFNDGSFQPQQDIQRWQLYRALVKALGLPDRSPQQLDRYYPDVESIPAAARGAIATATHHQLVIRAPGSRRIEGSRGATRAEVAASLYQGLALRHRVPTIQSGAIVQLLPPPPIPPSPAPVLTPAPAPAPEPSLPFQPDPGLDQTALLLPTIVLSPLLSSQSVKHLEPYLFGYSNQAAIISQAIATQLQEQGLNPLVHQPLSYSGFATMAEPLPIIASDSDLLLALDVRDQPNSDSAAPRSESPSLPPRPGTLPDDTAWQLLTQHPQTTSPTLAQTMHRFILEQTGLGDGGLQETDTLGDRLDGQTDGQTHHTTQLPESSLLLTLSPVQWPTDDYPPIPVTAMVRAIADGVLMVLETLLLAEPDSRS